jgi:hypothetical protein
MRELAGRNKGREEEDVRTIRQEEGMDAGNCFLPSAESRELYCDICAQIET